MSDVLTDLATYLAANTPLVMGMDLFGNDMPDKPDALTALYESPGGGPIETMGAASKPAVIVPRVQVQGRGTHDQARLRCYQVYDAIVLLTNTDLSGVYYHRVAPLQQPYFLRRDENERVYFSFNVEVHRVSE